MKSIKKVLFGLLMLVVVALLGVLCCVAYVDIQCSDAKKYLVDTYDLNKNEIHARKYTEYVYEDITDCSSLWLKKCTKDEDLLYEYVFNTKEGKVVIVKEDKDGNMIDNYNGYFTITEEEAEELNETLNNSTNGENTAKDE